MIQYDDHVWTGGSLWGAPITSRSNILHRRVESKVLCCRVLLWNQWVQIVILQIGEVHWCWCYTSNANGYECKEAGWSDKRGIERMARCAGRSCVKRGQTASKENANWAPRRWDSEDIDDARQCKQTLSRWGYVE